MVRNHAKDHAGRAGYLFAVCGDHVGQVERLFFFQVVGEGGVVKQATQDLGEDLIALVFLAQVHLRQFFLVNDIPSHHHRLLGYREEYFVNITTKRKPS